MGKFEHFIYMILSIPLVALIIKYLLNFTYIISLIYCLIVGIATYISAIFIIPYLAKLLMKIFR